MESEELYSQKIHQLFKLIFVENCEIDDEEVTKEELETLEDLQPLEVYENFKGLTLDLLKFKRLSKLSKESDLISQNEKLEILLQKLEGEIRTHFSNEHQLKIYIDIYQAKIEEHEKQISEYLQDIRAKEKTIKEKEYEIRILKKKRNSEHDLESKLRAIEEQFKEEIYKTVEQHTKTDKEFDSTRPEFRTFDSRKVSKKEAKSKFKFEDLNKMKSIFDEKHKEIEGVKAKISLVKDDEKSKRTKLNIESRLVDSKRLSHNKRDGNRDVNRKSSSNLLDILRNSSSNKDMKEKKRDISAKKKIISSHIRSSSDLLRSDTFSKKLQFTLKNPEQ